jgi:MerR-like DNA binding protein
MCLMAELTVGALARRTGLTIRTLHHYDEIGLLSPSGRTDAGYRLLGRGPPPDDVRVVSLAREWQSLLDEFTNGRFDIARSAGRMMRSEPAAQRRMKDMGLTAQVMDYVAQAMAYVSSGSG